VEPVALYPVGWRYTGAWGGEPKRKTCGLRPKCGRCANCQADAWSEIWRALSTEWQQWVIAQYALIGLSKWDAMPSPTRYVLR
jgi:hypothetical protein